jgi:hypothetical protein
MRRKKMCNECPFRANSPKGWLGSLTTDEVEHMVLTDEDLLCHKDINQRTKRGESSEEINEKGQMCVGMLRYTNSLMKLSRDPEKAGWQKELREIEDQPVIPARQFTNHHTRIK